jgi:hypothetical protein
MGVLGLALCYRCALIRSIVVLGCVIFIELVGLAAVPAARHVILQQHDISLASSSA